jgi:hypothetical protein
MGSSSILSCLLHQVVSSLVVQMVAGDIILFLVVEGKGPVPFHVSSLGYFCKFTKATLYLFL